MPPKCCLSGILLLIELLSDCLRCVGTVGLDLTDALEKKPVGSRADRSFTGWGINCSYFEKDFIDQVLGPLLDFFVQIKIHLCLVFFYTLKCELHFCSICIVSYINFSI